MSKGSERFAWKLFPGVPHECAVCGRRLLVDDVARHDTKPEGGRLVTRFYCREHVHAGYGPA